MRNLSGAGLLAGIVVALASPAHAQNEPSEAPAAPGPAATPADDEHLETIIVTATKTGETNLQSTPLAVTALTATQLDERGISDVRGLSSYTPGLQISDLSGYAQLYIRGIGSNTVFIGSDPSTTIHLDGVYLARPLSYFSDFLDVERVEVLRGPQGTLYGRNSVGGTINIISRKPSETFEGEVQAGIGNYDAFEYKGYLSGPFGKSGIRGSLAVNRLLHDDYFNNVSTGGDIGNKDSVGVRAQLLFPLGERGDFTLRGDYGSDDSALGQYPKLLRASGNPTDDAVLDDDHRVSMNLPNRTVEKTYGGAGELNYAFDERWSLKSLTAYRGLHASIDTDADSSDSNILRTLIDPVRQHQLSEELNLNAKLDDLDLVLGAFYFDEKDREPLTLAVIPAGISHIQRPDLEAESYALFGQGEYHLTPQWSLVAGLRWTHEKKDYELLDYYSASASLDPDEAAAAPPLVGVPGFSDPFTVDASRSKSAVTPKFGVNYQATRDVLVYAAATRGFKSGGFDYGATNAGDASAGYGPEYLWSYEIGAKTDWLEHRLRVNVDAFYYDYTDLQVEHYVVVGGSFGAVTQNAATAHVKGVEAEVEARPLRGLDLYASIAYLDARYSDYDEAYVGAFGDFDASGKRLNNSPEWSGTVGGNYDWPLASYGVGFVGADFHYQTRKYFTPANGGVGGVDDYAEQQGPYGLLNARIGWDSPGGAWRAMVVGDNLLDRAYVSGTANYTAAIAGRPGDPRTVKLLVSRKF